MKIISSLNLCFLLSACLFAAGCGGNPGPAPTPTPTPVPESLVGTWVGTWLRMEIFEDGTYQTQLSLEKHAYTRKGDTLILSQIEGRTDVEAKLVDSEFARRLVIGTHETLYQLDPVTWSEEDLVGIWRYGVPAVDGGDEEWFAGKRERGGSYIYTFFYLNHANKTYDVHYDRGTWVVTPTGLVQEVARMSSEDEFALDPVKIQMVRKGEDWCSWLLLSSERPGLIEEEMSLIVDRRAEADDLFVEIPYAYTKYIETL